MSKVYLALYKGRKSGHTPKALAMRFADWVIRKATRGIYSHCEIALALGDGVFECYSSSLRDGGVRCKVIPLPEAKWDLIPLPSTPEAHEQLQRVWTATEGQGYDLRGALGVAFGLRHNRRRWFCSEWCATALGLPDGWRWSPNDLAAMVSQSKM